MDAKKIILRPIADTDREQFLDMFTSSKVNQTYMLPDFANRCDAIPLFERLMALSHDNKRFVRCIDLEGVAIGYLNDVETDNGTIELGYVIHPDYHNRGYMTEALRIAIEDLFALGYKAVVCGAFEGNNASLRVMEKAGMTPIEKVDIIPYRNKDHRCFYRQIRNEE